MISIIIPTYNNFNGLKDCVESLINITAPQNIEIIISANGASDVLDLRNYTKRGYDISYIWNDKPIGYSKACNAGIKKSRGDYVVLLNDDVVFLPQEMNAWLKMLSAPFQNDTRMGITGPLLQFSPPANHNFIVFFLVMIKREVFDAIGLLDESFGMGAGEDTAFCIEAEKAGYKFATATVGTTHVSDGLVIGNFPVFHAGEGTVHTLPNWNEIFAENSNKLKERYNATIG